MVSLYDPEVQPMWAEIASRFGEGWIFPILDNGRLIGATEKWEMSGCVELRSFDLDRPEKLGEALDAVDRLMDFYRAIGYDVVRIREVMDKPTDDLEEEVRATLEAHGYHRLQGMYAKGGFVPVQYSEAQLMSYLLRGSAWSRRNGSRTSSPASSRPAASARTPMPGNAVGCTFR